MYASVSHLAPLDRLNMLADPYTGAVHVHLGGCYLRFDAAEARQVGEALLAAASDAERLLAKQEVTG